MLVHLDGGRGRGVVDRRGGVETRCGHEMVGWAKK